MRKITTIVISTAFQDAGDATRAIEIAKGLKEYAPEDKEIRIIFLSRGSRFEQIAIDLGFEVYKAKPQMSGIGLHQDLKTKGFEFIGEKSIAIDLIKGEIEAYKELRPDIILHGFWPIASVARRMLEKEIPGICFVPLPLSDAFLDLVPDIPEKAKPLSLLPYKIRMWIFKNIPKSIKRKAPFLRQKNICNAAMELGWRGEPLINIFSLLKADITIVNDLPDYYKIECFPENIKFTGPLFSKLNNNEPLKKEILEVFDLNNEKVKVFCTLGSSGSKKQLLEIVKVFTRGKGLDWNAVILCPSSVCPIEEAQALLKGRKGVYITDKFVPAQKVNSMADIVLCHGGQGTVQTALSCGTPIVGIAMQQEQQINLTNISLYGAAIRIPFDKWTSTNIQNAVSKVISDKKFKKSALILKEKINSINGRKLAAEIIYNKIDKIFFN
jgi:UDP:flavonoid glycosyltransferase YjiC (YdhE family)